jgi:hypothetical protein
MELALSTIECKIKRVEKAAQPSRAAATVG